MTVLGYRAFRLFHSVFVDEHTSPFVIPAGLAVIFSAVLRQFLTNLLRCDHRRKASNNGALSIDKELGKVPTNLALPLLVRNSSRQHLIELAGTVTVDFDL